MSRPATETELLRRLRAGDRATLSTIYHERRPAVYRFSLYLSRDPGLAEETVQEVFLALLRKPDGYDPARGGLTPYLLGIARRLLAKRMRPEPQPLDKQTAEPPADDDVFAAVDRARRLEALHQAVLSLPATYREAVALCDIEGLSYAAAAEAAGVAIGSIRSRLHRGRALLARKLAPLADRAQEITR